MLWRGPERDVIPLCAANGISQIVWSPLAQGVLTGKYKPGEPPPADSREATDEMGRFMGRATTTTLLERVQQLRPIADELGHHDGAARARVGAARAERRLGDHRRVAAGAGRGQRRRLGHRARRRDAAAIDEILGDSVAYEGAAS